MKFGLHIEQNKFLPWKNEYIQYNQLKYFLKHQQTNIATGWLQQDEIYFSETMIVNELNRVNGFSHVKIKQLEAIMTSQQETIESFATKINDLIRFIDINAVGFQKILKKHDKWTGWNLRTGARFGGIQAQFDSSISHLNQLNFRFKQQRLPASEASTTAFSTKSPTFSPPHFQQKVTTTSYWVHPENLTELKAVLLFNLPVFQPQESNGNNIINTIYFDNEENFSLYSELLERNEEAETIGARWYGEQPAENLFMESKRHFESWAHNKGSFTKERCAVKKNLLQNYLSFGQYVPNSKSRTQRQETDIASQIYQSMQKKQLAPMLRCYHHRTTYGHRDTFRITLDTNIVFLKETEPLWAKPPMSYPFREANNQANFFPYAVLDIKTEQQQSSTPQWLVKLIDSQLVYEIPYFSKYLHGTSYFYKNQLPMLPWWLGELEVDIRKKHSQQQQQQQTDSESTQYRGLTIIEPIMITDGYSTQSSSNRTKSVPYPIGFSGEESQNNLSGLTMVDTKGFNLFDSGNGHISQTKSHTYYAPTENNNTDKTYEEIAEKEEHQKSKDTTYESFANSNIVLKIKNMKEMYFEDPNKDENAISMPTWLLARLTNNKTILLPKKPEGTPIMPKSGKLKKIEPKIFFANERTFISWLQFSALLLSVSLGLVNFGDYISRGSGAFFILVAMAMAGYAQLRFQFRAWQIRFKGDSRFDDTIGPAVLCIVLVLALVVNLGIRVSQPLPKHISLFGEDSANDSALPAIAHSDSNSTNSRSSKTKSRSASKNRPSGVLVINKNGAIVDDDEAEEED